MTKKGLVVSATFLALAGTLFIVFVFSEREPEEVVVPEPTVEVPVVSEEVIGTSIEGRSIKAVTFGDGEKHLLFVGGIHGGYEWNSIVLAYQFIDYLDTYPDSIPDTIRVSVIPSLNPDGLFRATGIEGRFLASDVMVSVEDSAIGRFNAREVDLNRNFDCKWQPESSWRGKVVSAGTEAFSEPEAAALRDFVLRTQPDAVTFWHSQANNVYASECEGGVLPETLDIMNTYAAASGYGAVAVFDAYEITGDAEGWLASIGIPAITVELKTHETIEWEQNLAGVEALFDYYTNQIQ